MKRFTLISKNAKRQRLRSAFRLSIYSVPRASLSSMKTLLLAGLLLFIASCESEPVISPGNEVSMQVSAQEDTWLEIEAEWVGGFGGEAHEEYALYYVRARKWWQNDERHQLQYWAGHKGQRNKPVLRRVDDYTIGVDEVGQDGKLFTQFYNIKGPWPK